MSAEAALQASHEHLIALSARDLARLHRLMPHDSAVHACGRNKEDVEDVRREVQILHHLGGHPNITQLRGAFEDRHNVHLVMELCSGGELFDRIVARGFYRWAALLRLCCTPADGRLVQQKSVGAVMTHRETVQSQHFTFTAQ